jgi:hypothetical protein
MQPPLTRELFWLVWGALIALAIIALFGHWLINGAHGQQASPPVSAAGAPPISQPPDGKAVPWASNEVCGEKLTYNPDGTVQPGRPCKVVERGKITVRETLALAVALRNLDGRLVQATSNGQAGTLLVPWEFHSGSLRLRIANNLSIAEAVVATTERVRQKMAKDFGESEPAAFQQQWDQILNAPAAGTQDLARIKASELNLDKNEISVTVLAALKPILDTDQ